MKINKAFIKWINGILAGIITMLGFAGCEGNEEENIVPFKEYTVKGVAVNKANGKPVKGIQVAYYYPGPVFMYGVMPVPYQPNTHVITDEKGEFKLTGRFNSARGDIPVDVYVTDIDGEANGLFQPEIFQVDMSGAEQSKKPFGLYEGEYTATLKAELTEIEIE